MVPSLTAIASAIELSLSRVYIFPFIYIMSGFLLQDARNKQNASTNANFSTVRTSDDLRAKRRNPIDLYIFYVLFQQI
jgi:hypothetical protein